MKVRCWVMVGASRAGNDLPPQEYVGHYQGEPPSANNFKPGQWILWQSAPMQTQLSLVCVDVPL